jgi:acetyltransferase-like isoleucine patch superfamily enzyme
MIFTHTTHMRVLSEGKMGIIQKPVKIGAYTYLGSGAIVLPGVTIGDHCVIGAGAVVTNDIEPYSIAFGVPATTVGKVVVKDGNIELQYFQNETNV